MSDIRFSPKKFASIMQYANLYYVVEGIEFTTVITPDPDLTNIIYDPSHHKTVDLDMPVISERDLVDSDGVLKRDRRELSLIRSGLSPQEAHVIASIETGERPSDIAKRLGVSRQAVSDATRRGKIKMSKAP